MPDEPVVLERDQRQLGQPGVRVAQRIDEVGLARSLEGLQVDSADRGSIAVVFRADCDRRGDYGSPPPAPPAAPPVPSPGA
ncbi:MAG: hypothetical protein ACRDLQ_02130, partial [Solirubrobacterales bacterium]